VQPGRFSGTVDVTSEVGRGSRFRARFPALNAALRGTATVTE
jgi:signal transduction histidine kinase